MTKFYSETARFFFSLDMRADYEATGSWPIDAVKISDSDEVVIRAGLATGGTVTGTSGAWTVTPLPLAPLATRQSTRWESIKEERDQCKSGGVLVGTKWFHSDADSRIQQIGLVMMAASIPAGLQWKTLDGSFVTMTQALAGQIFSAVATGDQTVFSVAEAHRAAMLASASPETYDFSANWPKIYGE